MSWFAERKMNARATAAVIKDSQVYKTSANITGVAVNQVVEKTVLLPYMMVEDPITAVGSKIAAGYNKVSEKLNSFNEKMEQKRKELEAKN